MSEEHPDNLNDEPPDAQTKADGDRQKPTSVRQKLLLKRAYELSQSLDWSVKPSQYSLLNKDEKIAEQVRKVVLEDTICEDRMQKAFLLQNVIDELSCFGPVTPIMRDNRVREIRVLKHNLVMVDTGVGRWLRASAVFQNCEHLAMIVSRFISLAPAEEQRVQQFHMSEGFWITLNYSLIKGSETRRIIGTNSGHVLTEYNPPIISIQRMEAT